MLSCSPIFSMFFIWFYSTSSSSCWHYWAVARLFYSSATSYLYFSSKALSSRKRSIWFISCVCLVLNIFLSKLSSCNFFLNSYSSILTLLWSASYPFGSCDLWLKLDVLAVMVNTFFCSRLRLSPGTRSSFPILMALFSMSSDRYFMSDFVDWFLSKLPPSEWFIYNV